MQIELLDAPCPPFFRGFRHKGFVAGSFHAVLGNAGAELVRAVAVFAVDIVREHDVRLVLTNQLGDVGAAVLLSPAGIGFIQRFHVNVGKRADDGILANAEVP